MMVYRVTRSFMVIMAAVMALCIAHDISFATWSIIIVDPETKEVAIGSATCLTNFDLKDGSPVVLVDVGGACAQSMIDGTEINRLRIATMMEHGMDPEEIILRLDDLDFFHQQRQYGIVDTQDRAATFTGSQASSWAGGLTGHSGRLIYSIQGNILVDSTVVHEAEQAIHNTPGDITEKLMAAMEVARDQGGDSRCTTYGKSAHVGYILLARSGDIDGTCGEGDGCANGDYLMDHNVAFQGISDPDPVDQMREAYDAWRLELLDRPDAIASTVEFDTSSIPPNGESSATMSIALRDWQGTLVAAGIDSITVNHAEDSDRMTVVRNLTDLGGGQYSADVLGLESEGFDSYIVTAYDGVRPVQLAPNPGMMVEVPEGGFEIHPPVPGMAGEINEICTTGGTPGATVYFVYGSERGRVTTACGILAIPDGVVAGEVIVDQAGLACLSQMVGENAQGVSLRFQAVQLPGCDRSNVVVHEFQ